MTQEKTTIKTTIKKFCYIAFLSKILVVLQRSNTFKVTSTKELNAHNFSGISILSLNVGVSQSFVRC